MGHKLAATGVSWYADHLVATIMWLLVSAAVCTLSPTLGQRHRDSRSLEAAHGSDSLPLQRVSQDRIWQNALNEYILIDDRNWRPFSTITGKPLALPSAPGGNPSGSMLTISDAWSSSCACSNVPARHGSSS